MADKIDKIYEKLDHQTKEAYGVEYLSAFRHGIVGNIITYYRLHITIHP